MMGMMLFLSACGGGSTTPTITDGSGAAGGNGGGSHLTGPADISGTTQAQTGHLIVNDGLAIAHDGSLYVGTTTCVKAVTPNGLKVLMFDDSASSESHVEFYKHAR